MVVSRSRAHPRSLRGGLFRLPVFGAHSTHKTIKEKPKVPQRGCPTTSCSQQGGGGHEKKPAKWRGPRRAAEGIPRGDRVVQPREPYKSRDGTTVASLEVDPPGGWRPAATRRASQVTARRAPSCSRRVRYLPLSAASRSRCDGSSLVPLAAAASQGAPVAAPSAPLGGCRIHPAATTACRRRRRRQRRHRCAARPLLHVAATAPRRAGRRPHAGLPPPLLGGLPVSAPPCCCRCCRSSSRVKCTAHLPAHLGEPRA